MGHPLEVITVIANNKQLRGHSLCLFSLGQEASGGGEEDFRYYRPKGLELLTSQKIHLYVLGKNWLCTLLSLGQETMQGGREDLRYHCSKELELMVSQKINLYTLGKQCSLECTT